MESISSGTAFTGMARKMLSAIVVLAVLAMGVTAYLTYLHYVPSAAEFCNFNDSFNCDIVNKSQWSYIDLGFVQIPVAILGFLFYLGVVIGTVGVLKCWKFTKILKWFEPMNVIRLMRWLTVLGVIFALYLTYIETFVLMTYCIFCLIQQGLIILILSLFIGIKTGGGKKGDGKKPACCCGS